jgi:hypothetical protein
MMKTARFIAKVNPDRLSVSVMTPFPGTPIFDMAVRGEGNYRMLSDDWGAFDKYASGALELRDVSLSQLKLLQLYCYVNLYLRNGKVVDLVKMAWQHLPLVIEMVRGVLVSAVSGRKHLPTGTLRPRPLDLEVASVASPDATLVQLRRRGPALATLEESKAVRSWAAPGT